MEKLVKKGQDEVKKFVDKFYQQTVRGIAGTVVQDSK